MDTILWICQILLAAIFLYSGIMKSTQSEQKLVASGQTGVEHLPVGLIRFIGISEILGAAGLIIPWISKVGVLLAPLAAFCVSVIMVMAAVVHFRRNEKKAVLLKLFILSLCLFVGVERLTGF